MACYLVAPSHYLNQCFLQIDGIHAVLCHTTGASHSVIKGLNLNLWDLLCIWLAASLISPWLLWWPPAESHYNIYDRSVVGYISHAHSIVLLYSVGNKITTTICQGTMRLVPVRFWLTGHGLAVRTLNLIAGGGVAWRLWGPRSLLGFSTLKQVTHNW